jgi:alpha-methylacyl-CoA racemase
MNLADDGGALSTPSPARGPLRGVRIVEMGGLGPGPYAATMLADLGADVIRVERAQSAPADFGSPSSQVLLRSRRSIAIDLKAPAGVDLLLQLVDVADAMFETFRPGVAERLGIGPEVCMARNSRLVYGRMTGWGQDGPWAQVAGHDINYIALAGVLYHFGRAGEAPIFPLCLVGDFGGGGMLLAYGLVCAMFEAQRSGQGQVVDAAMLDGSAALMGAFHGARVSGGFDEEHRGTNTLDSGAPFYNVYECADGEYVSIGSLEPQFYGRLLTVLGLDPAELPDQMDRAGWPAMRERFAAIFRSKSRDQWCDAMDGHDVCFAPVLRMSEAVRHPHNVHREVFVAVDGIAQPSPVPRFGRTPGAIQRSPATPGRHTYEVLAEWLGLDGEAIECQRSAGAIH